MPQSSHQEITDLPQENFILIGEDDIDDQEFLKEIFTAVDNSFLLKFVDDGKKMITFLEEIPDRNLPCLVLMDYNMPGLNGAEILTELKKNKRYAHIPKVIWSTSNSEMYRNICLELGAQDYVIKPSNVREMEEVVKYMLSFC